MTGTIGSGALLLALAVAAWGAVVSVVGARKGRADLVASGRHAALAFFALATVAVGAMEYALLTHDFSVSYVAEVGSRSTPTAITIISLWSALEGSILFWLWILALYTALVAWLYRHRHADEIPYATATMLVVSVFFLGILVGPGDPFAEVSPVPADGPGPNPLLQNHPLMAFHPPAQYLGYVGFTVPFAFAVAALVTGHVGAWWVRAVRRWTLVAWIFLSLAIIAGGWWAYEVLGWGGYWAWDPVENAALLPWLTGTAFFHSVMVQERREMLRGWNVTLVVATFALTILGTFLTRSGVIGSVHAFTQSVIGPLFLGFLGVILVVSTGLLLWRSSDLATEGSLDSLLSREAAFLVANLLFVGLTFTVLLGTIFPLLAEAASGTKVSVGGPYFNQMTVPLFAAVVFLMGVGPALPWRRTSARGFWVRFRGPALGGVAAGVVAAALGVRSFWPLVTMIFSGFAATVMGLEVYRGVRTGVRRGANPLRALVSLVGGNRRRYGGYIVHTGVLIVAVAVAASWNYKEEREVTLSPGESVEVSGYEVRMDRVRVDQQPHRFSVVSSMSVRRDGAEVGRLTPSLNYYPIQQQPIPTPAVRSSLLEDVFVSLMAVEQDGSSATVLVVVTPLVVWLWVGGYIMAFGTGVAVWPERRPGSRSGGPGSGVGSAARQAPRTEPEKAGSEAVPA